MKIVIMTGRFGMGHYAAAQAIMQRIKSNDSSLQVEIIDWFEYMSPRQADRFYRVYLLIANKGSSLYNRRYIYRENRKTNCKPELSHYFMPHFCDFLNEKKPDLIISTLPFCSQLTSLYMDIYGIVIPLITCVTDITGHSEWISRNTGRYLVGSKSVKDRLIQKGVNQDKIIVTGIPVKKEFDSNDNNDTVKNDGMIHILIMGGGLGILPEEDSFYQALGKIPGVSITIITGRNKKLYHRLQGRYDKIHAFSIKGYVENVYSYMKWADVIISKPGGVTVFEAIQSGLPIIALKPCLQQEINNAKFIEAMQIGIILKDNLNQSMEQIAAMLQPDCIDYYRKRMQDYKSSLEECNLIKIITEMTQIENTKLNK